jgi:aldose 1-epimerase
VIARDWFGITPEGQRVQLFTLTNANGIEVKLTEYGGIVVSIKVPDRRGVSTNVVHGFPTLDGYVKDTDYVGAVVGRYANRIAGGQFTLLGRRYQLARNLGATHLHGGLRGFNKVVWHAEEFEDSSGVGAMLRYESPAGEEGYPGGLDTRVRYRLTDSDVLECDMRATSDEATHVNLTQHSYFNLSGSDDARGVGILDHVLSLNAKRFLPVDSRIVPTGELRDVKGTPFDFTTPTPIGLRIDANDEQLRLGSGYDHNWVVDRAEAGLVQAATLHDPASGRTLDVLTTQPGIQFYSGNWLRSRRPRSALALEPQHFPDTPNHPEFPTTVLAPGEEYHAQIVYRFRHRS